MRTFLPHLSKSLRHNIQRYSGIWDGVFLIILSIVCFLPYTKGLPHGTDLSLEVARIIEYKHALIAQGFPPLHADHLYFGFGSPIFLFYGPLFLLCSSISNFIFTKISTVILFVGFIFSSIGTYGIYHFIKNRYSRISGLFAAILLTANSYKFVDFISRNAYGEFCAFMLFPLFLWWSQKAITENTPTRYISLSICISAIFIAHNLSAFFFFPFLLLSVIFLCLQSVHPLQKIRNVLLATMGGLGVSAWFLVPMLHYLPLVNTTSLTTGKFDFSHHFVDISSLIFDPTSWFHLGPLFFFVLIGNLYFAWTDRQWWREPGGFFAMISWLVSILMITPQSSFLWNLLPPLSLLQFPWRFSVLVALFHIWNGAYLLHKLHQIFKKTFSEKTTTIAIFTILVLISTGLLGRAYINAQKSYADGIDTSIDQMNIETIRSENSTTTVFDEYRPKTVPNNPNKPSAIAEFQVAPYHYQRCADSSKQSISFPLYPLPYWRGYTLEHKPLLSLPSLPELTFLLPSGSQCVEIRLERTAMQWIGIVISLLSVLILFILGYRSKTSSREQSSPY